MKNLGPILVGLIVVLMVLSLSAFTVGQWQNAIVFQLGEVVKVIKKPGLYFKIPLLQNVRDFDVRIRTIDTPEPERFITSEKKNVLVDYYIKWRVANVRQYYVSVGGDAMRARTRLVQTINGALRAELGKRTVHEVVSGERGKIVTILRQNADQDASKIGVRVLDVRLKRVDLPSEVSDSVYRRMDAERKRVANELRATGAAEGEKIRADADRQREVILAKAYREAQQIKGEGDAKASAIYAAAYRKNPEFYAFYRSLEAYQRSFKSNDVMVLEPNNKFFKYFMGSARNGR